MTEDAILGDYTTNITSEGRDQITDYVSRYPTLSYVATAQSIKVGDYVVQPGLLMDDGDLVGYGVLMFETTGDGHIKHVWSSGAEAW